jgi:hypothetical protein
MNIKIQKNITRVFDSSIKVGWAIKTMLILSISLCYNNVFVESWSSIIKAKYS